MLRTPAPLNGALEVTIAMLSLQIAFGIVLGVLILRVLPIVFEKLSSLPKKTRSIWNSVKRDHPIVIRMVRFSPLVVVAAIPATVIWVNRRYLAEYLSIFALLGLLIGVPLGLNAVITKNSPKLKALIYGEPPYGAPNFQFKRIPFLAIYSLVLAVTGVGAAKGGPILLNLLKSKF